MFSHKLQPQNSNYHMNSAESCLKKELLVFYISIQTDTEPNEESN